MNMSLRARLGATLAKGDDGKVRYVITIMWGTKRLEPLRYRIVGGDTGRPWWKPWLPAEEWHVVSEFMSLGPFSNRDDAFRWWYGLSRGDPGPAMEI